MGVVKPVARGVAGGRNIGEVPKVPKDAKVAKDAKVTEGAAGSIEPQIHTDHTDLR